jgi:hypothetical protein
MHHLGCAKIDYPPEIIGIRWIRRQNETKETKIDGHPRITYSYPSPEQ